MPLFSSDVTVDNTVLIEGGNVNAVKTDGSAVTQPISGSVGVTGSVAVTGPLTDTQLRATPVPISGTVSTTALVATTSNITQVVLTNNTNATLLAINSARIRAIIFVPSQTLQIKLGATASTTSFTYKVTAANSTIEITGYTGRIDAFGMGQTVTITELT